ncbi:NADH dehydrogenase (ubiquinone) subunit ND-42 isoform X2 [Calliopsis andreniformis]|uniref:NADH dehydrogenase (ubiquinone) subunit ND-42 isoform X2 n=1 Tax=Calliopsis andreniformis TaxID=337506 RepID=UPI003FCC439D
MHIHRSSIHIRTSPVKLENHYRVADLRNIMASIFSIGVPKVNTTGRLIRLCKVPKNHNVAQVAFMKRLVNQEPRKKPPPFPYWKKSYNMFYQLMDPMTYRFDDNSKLIVVDGLPAVGKTKLCEQLAKEFGLLYMPAPIHEEIYINQYKEDLRKLDPQLPFLCQSFDLKRFCENPNDKRAAFFQLSYFLMRFEQYTHALLHLLSTGQGVILDRCVYSDIVFATAMCNVGYIRNEVLKVIKHVRKIGLQYILRPHVIIYLDVPVETVKDKIKQRGISYEVNSKVFTTQYLSDLEKQYKEQYLKVLSNHSHLLIYDWSKGVNYMDLCDNIESLDLNSTDEKLTDWIFESTSELTELRYLYDNNIYSIYCHMYRRVEDVDWPRELYWTPDEAGTREELYEQVPGEIYDYGYNTFFKDKVFWKIPDRTFQTIRRSPRDFINRTF